MKKLLILPLLMLLTGCVTYYYPETAYEDGVYYAEDDPSYAVYSDSYVGAAYYPWSSIDFFYTGYYPYSGYALGWGYYSGFSIGFNYAYSPWYYPYNSYGYYYPSYRRHHYHAYYPPGRPYRGYCSGHYNCGKNKKHHRGGKHDRYAGGGGRDRNDEYNDDRRSKYDDRERDAGTVGHAPVRRYVSTSPSGYSSNRGMVIRNNESTKVSKSRLEPNKSAPVQSAKASPSVSRTARPSYDTSGLGNDVRYRSGAKQSRSKTGPVDQSSPVSSVRVSPSVTSSAQPKYNTKRAGNDVRYRSDAKQSRSRTGPVNSGSTARGMDIVSAPSPKKGMTAPVSGRNAPTVSSAKRSEPRQQPPSNTRSAKPNKSRSSNSGSNRSRSKVASSSVKQASKSNKSSRRQRRD